MANGRDDEAGRPGEEEESVKALCARGLEAYDEGRFEEAADWFRRAVSDEVRASASQRASARHNWGLCLDALGRIEEAEGHYAEAVAGLRALVEGEGGGEGESGENGGDGETETDPEGDLANCELAWAGALEALGRFDEAIETYRRATDRLEALISGAEAEGGGADAEGLATLAAARCSLGYLLRETGGPEEALGQFLQATRIQRRLLSLGRTETRDEHATAWSHLEQLFEELDRVEEGIAECRDSAEYFERLAVRGRSGSRRDEASARVRLGRLLDRHQRQDDAREELERAIGILEAMRSEAFERGAGADEARGLGAELAGARYQLGGVLDHLGRLDRAARVYREAVEGFRGLVAEGAAERRIELSNAHTNLGSVLGTLGRLEEAVEHFEQAAALDESIVAEGRAERLPDLIDARVNLGIALNGLDRRDEAIEQYERALALHDALEGARAEERAMDAAHTMTRLAILREEAGRLEEASAGYAAAAERLRGLIDAGASELEPDLALVRAHLGRVELRSGRIDEASRELSAAVKALRELVERRRSRELAADLASALTTLGHAKRARGDLATAAALHQAAAELDRQLVEQGREDLGPRLSRALTHWGETLEAMGKGDEALRAYRQAAEVPVATSEADPEAGRDQTFARWRMARAGERLGDALGTEVEYRALIETSTAPESHRDLARARRARLHARAGRWEEAIEELSRSIASREGRLESLGPWARADLAIDRAELGDWLASRGLTEDAAHQLESALELLNGVGEGTPGVSEARLSAARRLADALAASGGPEAAEGPDQSVIQWGERLLKRGWEESRGDAAASHARRAELLARRGQHIDAVSHRRRARELSGPAGPAGAGAPAPGPGGANPG